ncbi:MAG: ATP-binding protein [Flammeovirgaceae bacterium]|nr:ATP-binding protein [Flammeovirgaceae bacterium]
MILWGLVPLMPAAASADTTHIPITWHETKKAGKGSITVYWYKSQPFIYQNEDGSLGGIEFDIINRFKKYLKEKHEVDLTVDWAEGETFGGVFEHIQNERTEGTFGASFFSITPDRQKKVDFTPPYLADISVLISSHNVPVVRSIEEFNKVFSTLTALTIKHTTYEQDLLRLKEAGDLNFKIEYIPSSENVLLSMENTENTFGFIDLPVYMILFKQNPSMRVKRQNMFPIIREGYALIMPEGSSWHEPFNEFFADPLFKVELEKIISNYIDPELYRMVENLSLNSNDPITLLTKEKEIQYLDLLDKKKQLETETQARNLLITLLAISLTSLLIIVLLYRKKKQQQIEIKRQNEHLLALDEEKDNLIKILAHDMRTPINHVQGMAQLLSLTNSLSNDQQQLAQNINDSTQRLNKMITNILDLDSLEHNRTKISNEKIEVTPLVAGVVKSFQNEAERKNIQLRLSNSENVSISGDILFLTQVFENLISNALKFSEKGKTVEVLLTETQGKIKISVKDQGPGLAKEELDLLFKKFRKLSTRPTAGESSIGLGLSIVKKYVELMNGKVWCESEPGVGSTFHVEFTCNGTH